MEGPKKYKREYLAHQRMLKGEGLGFIDVFIFAFKIPFSFIEGMLRGMPGPVGYKLRYYYYKIFFKKLGKNVLIDIGVKFSGLRNISVGDYSYIDSYSLISAYLNEVQIGKRVHVAPFCIIHANEKIVIEDFVGVSAGVKIYSSTSIANEKKMSGPTVPKEEMSLRAKEIIIRKESVLYSNCLLLPGADIGEGAVVCANAIISKPINPYVIAMSNTKIIGKRPRPKTN